MSFAPSGTIVDLDKLVAAYGSKKTALATAALNKDAKRVDHNAEWFADAIAAGAPRLDTALREIIAGTCTKPKHGFQYIYALELLAGHLGTALFMADYINCEYLTALGPALPVPVRKLLSSRVASDRKPPLLPLPRQRDAVPGVGYYTRDECTRIAKALAEVKLVPDRKYGPARRGKATGKDLEEGFPELRDWFVRAAKAKRGLMMFWY